MTDDDPIEMSLRLSFLVEAEPLAETYEGASLRRDVAMRGAWQALPAGWAFYASRVSVYGLDAAMPGTVVLDEPPFQMSGRFPDQATAEKAFADHFREIMGVT